MNNSNNSYINSNQYSKYYNASTSLINPSLLFDSNPLKLPKPKFFGF
jgi:hypothetical protein